MARIEVRMPAPEGVGAGQTATFKLPIGRRFHELQLAYAGVTLAQLEEIRIYVNGKVIQRFSAAIRDAMNQFDALPAANGILVIPFDRQNLKTLLAEETFAINTGSRNPKTGQAITSFYVEIDIAAAAAAPKLSMTATQSEAAPGGPGLMLHILKHPRTFAGAGEFDVSDLPYGTATTQSLNRLFVVSSANNVDHLKVERDNYVIFERSKPLNDHIHTGGVRIPQDDFAYVLDKTERGIGGDPIQMIGATDFRFKFTVDGAMTATLYSETMGALGE